MTKCEKIDPNAEFFMLEGKARPVYHISVEDGKRPAGRIIYVPSQGAFVFYPDPDTCFTPTDLRGIIDSMKKMVKDGRE